MIQRRGLSLNTDGEKRASPSAPNVELALTGNSLYLLVKCCVVIAKVLKAEECLLDDLVRTFPSGPNKICQQNHIQGCSWPTRAFTFFFSNSHLRIAKY